ncbi:MAG: GntG family PLP-dependent aldolase [Bacteroidia bacterium]|nr:GntG family PLP-dependent aldolase [Bacteroidia bacterium]
MTLDFRSDTLTRPTPGMRAAMAAAPVGDDVFGEDELMQQLEARLAELFGKEAGLFCPSGTMCNQIAIRVHTRPQDEVICDRYSHVYLYEGGGIMAHSLCSVALIDGHYGRITAEQVRAAVRPDDQHFPNSALVVLENTANKGGGACYDPAEIAAIRQVCTEQGLALHLDGARIFNALAATGGSPAQYGPWFDTISVCLSKGLGAPVGSVLLGSRAHIARARRIRKFMGGGMRQVGMLAAAGLYALDHHIGRLADDHRRAAVLADTLRSCAWVTDVMPVQTNIVGFRPDPAQMPVEAWLERLRTRGLLGGNFGGGYIRLVTHLDLDDAMLEEAVSVLRSLI